MVKLTKMQKFEMISNIAEVRQHPILAEFIAHEMELLAKKNATEKKPTAQQVANKSLMDVIYDGMEVGKKYSITDIIKTIDGCAELTNQRVSALMRQMIGDGRIERTEEKRKAYFSKVG